MKKTISLLLAVTILLSMMTTVVHADQQDTLTACGVVGFKDLERITYTNAVAITAGIGLFTGTDTGKFEPHSQVTRAQMATIVVKMLKGADFSADAYKGNATPFPDTAGFEGGWAEGYINVCAQMGIVTGYGNGTFQPGNPVTAAEALTMVLNALKVDAGAGEWPNTVMAKAEELNLCSGLTVVPQANTVLNREQLAAIVCEAVQYKYSGGDCLLSSVFGVKKINTEHKFGETHCEVCRTAKPGLLTRADLEQAVTQTALAYYLKGNKQQYCSAEVDLLTREYGGHYRVTEDVSPEFGTEDSTIYAVCADWAYKVWLEAVGHRIMNLPYAFQTVTEDMWRLAENQPEQIPDSGLTSGEADPVTENDVNECVLRWKSSDYKITAADARYGIETSPAFANFGDYHLNFANGHYATTPEEQEMADNAVQDFINNWDVNLRPGDVFVIGGHALLHIGNGYVLDSNSDTGGKYNPTSGTEIEEPDGTTWRMCTVEYWFTSGESQYWIDEDSERTRFVLLRPSLSLCQDDGDGILGNDLVTDPNFTIPKSTQSRLDYPGLEIDRTVNITPYGTAAMGEELTYTIKISNKSNETNYVKYHTYGNTFYTPGNFTAVPVSETIPDGTELVRATGDYKLDGGKLNWTLDIPTGQTVELSYTVKVTANMGDTIVNDGGFVADIPSNNLSNTVGGKKLTADQLTALTSIADTDPALWREQFNVSRHTFDLNFAERLYQKMGIDLQLPTVAEIAANVFEWRTEYIKGMTYRTPDLGDMQLFMLKESVAPEYQQYRDMLINGYWGGYRFFTGYDKRGTSINEFHLDNLEPGDILVYVTEQVDGVPSNSTILFYAGKDSQDQPTLLTIDSKQVVKVYKGDEVEARIWKAMMSTNALFFALRPSQAVTDLSDSAFDPAKEPTYAEEPAVMARPTTRGTTELSAGHLAALAELKPGDAFGQRFAFVIEAYKKIGIPGLKKMTADAAGETTTGALAILERMFTRIDGTEDEYNRLYTLTTEKALPLQFMLVDNYYGGRWIQDDTTGQTPSINGLQPGDILVQGKRHASDKTGKINVSELASIYQGNGKFFVGGFYWATRDGEYGLVPNSYKYGTLDFSGVTPSGVLYVNSNKERVGDAARPINDLTAGTAEYGYAKIDSYAQFLTNCPLTNDEWDFYYVLRPSQGAYDIEDLNYDPNVPAATE